MTYQSHWVRKAVEVDGLKCSDSWAHSKVNESLKIERRKHLWVLIINWSSANLMIFEERKCFVWNSQGYGTGSCSLNIYRVLHTLVSNIIKTLRPVSWNYIYLYWKVHYKLFAKKNENVSEYTHTHTHTHTHTPAGDSKTSDSSISPSFNQGSINFLNLQGPLGMCRLQGRWNTNSLTNT